MSVVRSEPYRRAAQRALRWASWYTRGLEPTVAGERLDEIASDLHEHAMWAEEAGMTPEQLGRDIHRRRVHGMFDDLLWRYGQGRGSRDPARAGRVVLALGGVLAVALLAAGGKALVSTIEYVTTIDDPRPITLAGITAGLALSLLGLGLLLPRRTRFVGALALALGGPAIVYFGLAGLEFGSALVSNAVAFTPGWRYAELGLTGAVGLLFTAAAVWWWPSRAERTP